MDFGRLSAAFRVAGGLGRDRTGKPFGKSQIDCLQTPSKILTRQAPLRKRQGAADLVAFGPSRHRAHPGGSSEGSWRVLGAVLVSRGASFEPLGGFLEPLVGFLGRLGSRLGASWGFFRASWEPLGASCGPLGGMLGVLGAILEGKARNVGSCSPSGAHLGAVLGPSWAVLEASWAVLGPSWAVLGRSWGPLGPSWAGLGGLLSLVGQWEARKGDNAKIIEKLNGKQWFWPLGAFLESLLERS